VIEQCLRVEFAVTGDDCPLAAASAAADATIECRPPQLRRDGNVLLQFSTRGDEADAVAATLDGDDRIRYLHASSSDGRTNFRCLSKHPCVVHELTDAGFVTESLQYREGTESYVGAVVGNEVLQGVLAAAGDAVGVTLQRVHQLRDEEDTPVATRWDVTPAQEAALRAALEAGYFEVPRAATAGEVAAELDISKSAFLERLRRGQAGLLGQVLG
jgi:predicted DNA binding protein